MNHTTTLAPLGALMAGLAFCSSTSIAAEATSTDKTKEASLPAVEVNGTRDAPTYVTTQTRVGKVLQDPHDVPQALTTVTSKLLEEQQAGSLREAMRNVAGLSFNAAEGGRSGDNMNLRGFYTFGDMYLDGIRDTAQYNREIFQLEQIDVLRGAGAMLFGRGQAGGVINQVSKTPHPIEQYRLTGSLGSDNYRQLTADINKPVNDDVGLRLNLMHRDEGSWRSNPASGAQPELHRQGAALSLALNQTGQHKFWLNHYTLRTRDNPDYGISFDTATRRPGTRLPANYFWGTDKTFDNSDTTLTTLVHEVRFSPDTVLRNQLRTADYQRSYWAKTPNVSTPPNAVGGVGGNQTRASFYDTTTLQSDLSTHFTALGMRHAVVTGLEYLVENSYRRTLQNLTGSTTTPDFRPYLENTAATASSFKGDSYAVYAQDTIEFLPKWKATLGARRDQMNAKYSSGADLNFGEWSSRSAVSFHPSDESHYYLAWSDSFSPTADLYQLTTTTTPKPPERSDILELGVKYLLADGDLALRAAVYRANKVWERNADLEATTAPILTKKRRTDGIELELAGRITEHWEMFSGLALMDATVLEVVDGANTGFIGQRARNTPRYTLNLWTTYKIATHWKLGGGLEAKGDRYAYVPSSGTLPTLGSGTSFHPNTAPAYQRWDAMLAYDQKSWSAKLNVRNLFNKLYYDSVYDNGGFTVPGARRAVIITAEFKY